MLGIKPSRNLRKAPAVWLSQGIRRLLPLLTTQEDAHHRRRLGDKNVSHDTGDVRTSKR